jgi:uncharacterized protein (TIGR02271 family)
MVLDPNGQTAQILGYSSDQSRAQLRLGDGRTLWIDRRELVEDGGSYQTKLPLSSLASTSQEHLVVPVIEERLHVDRQTLETGTVRIEKHVHERQETVDQPVMREDVQVERIVLNQPITEAPSIRYEGETMVIPLVEEVLYVEKRLMLREELRVTRRRETVSGSQQVTLRSEEAHVSRIAPQDKQGENTHA